MPDDQKTACTRRQALTLAVGAGAVAALGATLAACDGKAPDAAPGPVDTAVDVTTFGAVGDGRTDDTAAVQRALDSLREGDVLRFPAGGCSATATC